MYILLMNGAPGTGKTYMAHALENALHIPQRMHAVQVMSFADPLRKMLRQLHLLTRPSQPYAELAEMKSNTYYGLTGREWMIQWGTAMREKNPTVFCEILKDRIIHAYQKLQADCVIVDDLGFDNEHKFMFESFRHVEIAYLEERALRQYAHGDIFDGDSRECLVEYADLVDPSKAQLIDHVRARINRHGSTTPLR